MEEAVCAGGDGLIAIDATRTDDADGGRELAVLVVHALHDAGLHGRGVRTQQDVLRFMVVICQLRHGVRMQMVVDRHGLILCLKIMQNMV